MIFQPLSIKVRDQQTIDLNFSSSPSLFLTKANFNIISTFTGVSDLDILSIDIQNTLIVLRTRPMFADNLYLLTLLDQSTQPFEDINNIELSTITDARQIYFVGIQVINTVRDSMLQVLPPNYDTGDQTLVYDLTASLANEINVAGIAVEEIKNDNFISIPVIDELYFRGHGPTDRLKNEGVFQVSRVAKTTTGTNFAGLKAFNPIIDPNIPFEIINLRVMQVIETIPDKTKATKFDEFLITVSRSNITKLISVLLMPDNITYNPAIFGYALANNNYDRLARRSLVLKNNQILLSSLTNGAFPTPIPGDILTVVYEFDNVGRRIDKSSISLFTVLQRLNENVPSSITNFFLNFANIVNAAGTTNLTGMVIFQISPINLNKHSAFIHEIVFNADSLPSEPGEYSIKYTTGQVFVFGTQSEIGTGTIPPVASYFYKSIAVSNIDYFINDDGYNISLNSFSQFAIQPFSISFLYEEILTPGIDYLVSSHIEVINERINNRLIGDFGIQVNNGPVKEVYQIHNETTGESYTPGLIESNKIFFTGNVPPKTSITLGELAQLGIVDDEALNVITITTTPNGLIRVFLIALAQKPILNQRQDGIGSDFDSSAQFTRTDLFINELYFNPFESIQINLGKLNTISSYLIDYASGNIYLSVSSTQNFDVGHVSYAYGAFIPVHKNVLGVSNIGIGTTSTHIIQEFDVGLFETGLILPKQINYGYDVFDGVTRVPNSNSIFVAQLQDNFTVYTKNVIKKVYGVFTQNDVEQYDSLTLIGKNLFNAAINSFNGTVIDLKTYIILSVQADSNPNYYSVVIPDDTTVVKSIIAADTGVQLLDTQLYVITFSNIIIKSVVAIPLLNPTQATITLQNIITLTTVDITAGLDSLVDIAGHRFVITSVVGGNLLTVAINNFTAPVTNVGSQILDHNGILVANHLNIVSVTALPNLLYILHYDIFPIGILVGYQVKDYNGNIFIITDVQTSSVIVAVVNAIIPIIDPAARIETQSLLVSIGPKQTKLMLPLDAPIVIGTNIQIGYIPADLNNSILAANLAVGSAGGTGMLINYSIGQFFIDYNHLDDELLVSYDWGDNQLDWSISDTLHETDPYFVSYKYGASRNGLETNFGALTKVDFLQTAPLVINREVYRTAVGATIKAFLKGPTHEAIRLLAHAFTQVDPDIREFILNQWIVGRDPLNLQVPTITGQMVFGNGKFSEGLALSGNNSIQLPGDSSLRLSQGTFSSWFRPNWNGNQADEAVVFTLPTALLSVYYNAHSVMPQNTVMTPWYLAVESDAYGTAHVTNDYLEVRNSKNEYLTGIVPVNDGYDGYGFIDGYDGYDGYLLSSVLDLHDGFTLFNYANKIGKYLWYRNEQILSAANDLDINFGGYVNALNYVNPISSVVKVAIVGIDDGYGKWDTGFYLFRKSSFYTQVVLEDVHLSILPPFPHNSPPIIVSTTFGSAVIIVNSGNTNSLSVGQQITIGSAFPMLTNILGFTSTTITMRIQAIATLSNVSISQLDPVSTIGTQDGFGETHLVDKLGDRLSGTIDKRTNGWDRQLLVKVVLTIFAPEHMMVLGSQAPPLTPQTPAIDLLFSIIPGTDIFVDAAGNVFEVDHIQLPFVWLKKPSASGAALPIGIVTAFRKVAGISLPDQTLISTPINWSNTTSYLTTKRSGILTLTVAQMIVSGSYVLHYVNNTSGVSSIRFGQPDLNVDSTIRIQNVDYSIYSILKLSDIHIGNTGNNPLTDSISFKYSPDSSGIPAINANKYMAIFTNKSSAAINEPVDEIFVKMKIPSSWTLNDGLNSVTFQLMPIIKFSATTTGDIINITDGYGLIYNETPMQINFTAIDGYAYIPGHSSILFDGGPELRISAGKRHFLFDAETPEGSLKMYRSGNGFLNAEVRINDPAIYNIRANISSWAAGQLHYLAMSWKINSPDATDELHLFIDGDEVPNEITFGSNTQDGYIGQIYQETLIITQRIASLGGFIINDFNGSGVFIPTAAIVQPDIMWIDKTIVLNATIPGPNIFLNMPLIVGAIIGIVGGTLLFVSQNGKQVDFSIYGPSTPILYGLATSTMAVSTILTRVNFGLFKNGIELSGSSSIQPQFRQVGITQTIELYSIDPITTQYVESVLLADILTIRTYGLLSQRIKQKVYQFGNLIRNAPISLNTTINGQLISTDVMINNGASAFITDLPQPIDPTQVKITKILLPEILI